MMKNKQTSDFLESLIENCQKSLETGSGRVWGIEDVIEREAGRARRGQDRAKIGPKKNCFWSKIDPKIGHHPGDPVHSARGLETH